MSIIEIAPILTAALMAGVAIGMSWADWVSGRIDSHSGAYDRGRDVGFEEGRAYAEEQIGQPFEGCIQCNPSAFELPI